jgi:two-component system, chemotaxis family, sensor kinase CheA
MQQEVAVHSLQTRIDELSTQLILNGVDSALIAELRRLSEAAQQSGCLETAIAALTLAGEADHFHSGDEKQSEDRIRQGLSALSKVLEIENGKAAVLPLETAPVSESPVVSNSLAEDPELVGDFITESREHLNSIETQMLVLEQTPGAIDAIHAVFRGFHTIKGLAGFLEFTAIQTMAHEVETLLDLARNEKLSITPAVVDLILESADYLKEAMDAVECTITGKQPKPVRESASLLQRIRQRTVEQPPIAEQLPSEAVPPKPSELPKAQSAHTEAAQVKVESSAPKVEAPASQPPAAKPIPASLPPSQPKETKAAAKSGEPAKSADTFSVRVETAKLDHLMEMVGEMVIAQSMLRHSPALAAAQDPGLSANISQLARITAEVQRTAMAMRMVQVGQLFQRSARMVRDLSRKLKKEVVFEISGEDTELDKTIAEELSDPLLHMVRNAIDHGVELPEERRAAGKNPTACVRLAAYHKAGQIVIEIGDDGKGLAREKILKKAKEKGLVTDGSQLTDSEVFHLIFEPGFSTAEQITDISGRGVGMDVVRKNIQKMRGRIEIQSKVGEGTTFFLKLPLTLAIIEGLVVLVGEHRYIVPLFAVKEMFRATPDLLSTVRGREEMALVRGRLLPIVRLARRLKIEPRSQNACEGLLVVVECEGKQFCLLVDDLIGKQEVVIKSLGESLKNVNGVAGCAILGDGRVGLILDMEGIYRGHA